MENLFERLENSSLFAATCDASQGVFEPHVRPVEANALRAPCDPRSINVVSCKNPHISTFLEEVHGLDFRTVRIVQPTLEFPSLIPIIDRRMFNLPGESIRSNTVGISLEDVFSSAPKKVNGRQFLSELRIRENILDRPVFEGKKVVLFCSGRDILIENLWCKLDTIDFVRIVGRMGFAAITGINFSIFYGECPFSHALNLKRSLESTRLFHEGGIKVIPHVYFAHQFHIERWVAWLNDNPTIGLITVNCQFRSKSNAAVMAQGISYLMENTSRKIKVILEGPDPMKMKSLFCSYPNSIVVALKGLSLSAQFHREYRFANGTLKRFNNGSASIGAVFDESIRNYANYLKSLSLPTRSKPPMNRSLRKPAVSGHRLASRSL